MDETPFTLALAATFAAAPLSETLWCWIRESGAGELVEAPPDQILDHLREADGVLRSRAVDVGVALVRFADVGENDEEVESWIDIFADEVRRVARRGTARLVVIRCADSRDEGRGMRLEDRLRAAIHDAAEFVGAAEIAQTYPVESVSDASGRVSDEYSLAIATTVARRVSARRAPQRTVLALDCDGALWRGPCGATKPHDVVLDEWHVALQEFARDRARDGWRLALIGRCDERYVRRVLASHPEWPLRLTDLDVITVGWHSKASQVARVARELDVRTADIVVIDHDRADCRSISDVHPGVLALPLPRVPRDTRNYLSRIWAFDRAPTTAHPDRSNAIGAHDGARPQVRLDVRLAESDDFAAVSDFSRRPLRYNASGTSVSTEEVAWYASQAGRDVLLVAERASRRLVAAARVRQAAGALRLDDCWVEHESPVGPIEGHLLRALGRMAVSRGIEHLEIRCLRNRSNSLLRDYLLQRGGLDLEHEIHLTLAQALASVEIEQASVGRGKRSVATATIGVSRTAQNEARQASPTRPFRLPTTDAERWVSGVWREVLGVDRIGADDDFFALGGDSLAATRALARIRAAFGVEMPVSVLFDEPTLAAQAAHLVRARIAGSDPELVRALFDQESLGEVVDE